MSRNRFVVLVGVLAMSGLLAASVGVTAAAGPDAAASAGKAKKCKKLKGKAKKKCLKRLKQQQQAATAPTALKPTTISVACTSGCAPYLVFPINAFNDTTVTLTATLAGDTGGTPVVVSYRGGAATPTFTETLTTGAGGVVSKTHDLNNDFGYDNVFTASFAGDATRAASSGSLTYHVSD